MSDKPISPLRQRMIDDMTARRVKEKVQKDYVRHVRTFAAFLGRSPDTATRDDLRRFQLHMAQQLISAGSINLKTAVDRREAAGFCDFARCGCIRLARAAGSPEARGH